MRAKHRIFRQSYVGGLYTGRNIRGSAAPTRQHPRRRLSARHLVVPGIRAAEPRRLLRQHHATRRVRERTTPSVLSWIIRTIRGMSGSRIGRFRPTTTPAVGFTPRTGFRRLAAGGGRTTRPRGQPVDSHDRLRRPSLDLQCDTAGNGLLNRDIDVTADQCRHAHARLVSGARAAQLREARARLRHQPGHPPARRHRYTYTRYRFSLLNRAAAQDRIRTSGRTGQLLQRHAAPVLRPRSTCAFGLV